MDVFLLQKMIHGFRNFSSRLNLRKMIQQRVYQSKTFRSDQLNTETIWTWSWTFVFGMAAMPLLLWFSDCIPGLYKIEPIKQTIPYMGAENEDFDQRFGCTAPKCWSKYTTNIIHNITLHLTVLSELIWMWGTLYDSSPIFSPNCQIYNRKE